MFKIIGADQKEYGPISTEQIRQWIRDGRLNSQTPAQRAGEGEWQQLSAFEEFADLFQTGAAAIPGGPTPTYAPSAVPGPLPTGSREAALSAVKGPAIALIVVASIGIVLYLISIVGHLLGSGQGLNRDMSNLPPQLQEILRNNAGPQGALFALLALAINAFVLIGALKMLKLQSHTFAIITCIVAMIPCSCCCFFGLPFGIWGLVMLNKPDVKSQFS